MSIESIASQPLPVFDVPEMEKVEASFTYNFFVADETINETGNDRIVNNREGRLYRIDTHREYRCIRTAINFTRNEGIIVW